MYFFSPSSWFGIEKSKVDAKLNSFTLLKYGLFLKNLTVTSNKHDRSVSKSKGKKNKQKLLQIESIFFFFETQIVCMFSYNLFSNCGQSHQTRFTCTRCSLLTYSKIHHIWYHFQTNSLPFFSSFCFYSRKQLINANRIQWIFFSSPVLNSKILNENTCMWYIIPMWRKREKRKKKRRINKSYDIRTRKIRQCS